MLLAEFISRGIAALEPLYPTAEARSIVLMLCGEIIGTKNYTHIVEPRHEIAPERLAPLQAAMERLKAGEPIQYVIGKAEFCGRTFSVTPDVLIPRPETELLALEAVKIASRIQRMRLPYGNSAEPVRVLDLCTGSGNIAWTVALGVPGALVTGVDKSASALKVARGQNFAAEMKTTGAIAPAFVEADVLDFGQISRFGKFDIVLSNPPYIMDKEKPLMRRNVLDYEPSEALFVPDDDPLLFHRAIAVWSERLLGADGKGLTEINEALGAETLAVFSREPFQKAELVKDFYDKNRFVLYMKPAV